MRGSNQTNLRSQTRDNRKHSASFQIKNSLLNYPSLYANRTEVLEHYFCVLGSGVEWKKGSLVAYEDDLERGRESKNEIKRMVERFKEAGVEGDALDRLNEYYEEEERHKKDVEDNIEEYVEKRGKLKYVYPMSKDYANLALIPEDIKDDWLLAAEEIAYAVLECNTTAETRSEEEQKQALATNHSIAKEALQKIDRLKKERGL